MKKFIAVMLASAFFTTQAIAHDLGKARATTPDDRFISKLKMYDIERCMVEVDAVDQPVVYRQPDRPNEEMIAWYTAIVIELRSTDGGTEIVTHFQTPGGRKARKRLLACAGHEPA